MRNENLIRASSVALVILIGQGGCGQLEDEPLAETEQDSLNFSTTLMNLPGGGPEAYWRLGEKNGTVATDSTANHINGNYINNSKITWVLGGVTDDPNNAIRTDENLNTGYVDIPDDRRLSLTRAWDNFDRPISGSWGTSSGGDGWAAQVSTSSTYYSVNGSAAVIDPHGASGTFQMGLNVTLKNGDAQVRAGWSAQAAGGTLQPVTLVARRVDNNNFVRAALEELADTTLQLTLSSTYGGVTTSLGSAPVVDAKGQRVTYHLGQWYYLRFQFEGSNLRAKAWLMDSTHTGVPTTNPPCAGGCPVSYEPPDWVTHSGGFSAVLTATDPHPQTGAISIRSANSLGTARPSVAFDDFWYQTVGFTVHYLAYINTLEQIGDNSRDHTNDLLGKGASHNTSDKQSEYEARYIPANAFQDPKDPNDTWVCKSCLKFYTFNINGGLGAGTSYPDANCDANGLNCNVAVDPSGNRLATGRWYDIVAELDSGDWLDPKAGVSMYVNGKLWADATTNCAGNLYSGLNCNMPGTPEWQIVPSSGTRSLKLATFDTYQHWNGELDEVAIFPRKLSASEVATLYSTLTAP